MNYLIKFLFFSLLTLSSCQSDVTEQTPEASKSNTKFSKAELNLQQQAWDKVMKIHDEIMPKMGTLDKVGVSLDEAIKKTTDPEKVKQLKEAKKQIDAADKLMWDWMYALVQLDDLRSKKNHQEITTYLTKELSRIKKVKEKMETSIKTGSELIK